MILATTVTEWATLVGALGSFVAVLLNLKQAHTTRATVTEEVVPKLDDVKGKVENGASNG